MRETEVQMSTRITIRLSTIEQERLDKMAASEVTGCENRCEFVRLLLKREWNRRHGLEKPKPYEWQSASRIGGRPKAG
jgi:hypothetical protein